MAADGSKAPEAGAPVLKITPQMIPEGPLLEASHRLSLLVGVGVPLADYAEAAALLFSELSSHGWTISPGSTEVRSADGTTMPTSRLSRLLAVAARDRLRA